MCDVSNLEAIAFANQLCNDYGLDTISTGSTIAFTMECFEKGILQKDDFDGMEIRFGDDEAMIQLIHKIGQRDGVGNLLAEGTKRMSAKLGQNSEHFAMHVKGLELPAYDCRATKMTGVGFCYRQPGAATISPPTFKVLLIWISPF